MKKIYIWFAAALTLAALAVGVVFLVTGTESSPRTVTLEGLFGNGKSDAERNDGMNPLEATVEQGLSGPGRSDGGTVLSGPPQNVNRTDQTQWWGTPAPDAPINAQGARLHPEDPERTHREMNEAFEKQQENLRKLVTQEQN